MKESEIIEGQVKQQLPNTAELEVDVAVTKALLSNVVDNELPHMKTDIREIRSSTRWTLRVIIGGILSGIIGLIYILIRGIL